MDGHDDLEPADHRESGEGTGETTGSWPFTERVGRRSRGRRPLAERPTLKPSTIVLLTLPADWPEVTCFLVGHRLAKAGEETATTLLRQGLPIGHYLTDAEAAAWAELPDRIRDRWFRRGWWSWMVGEEEGG